MKHPRLTKVIGRWPRPDAEPSGEDIIVTIGELPEYQSDGFRTDLTFDLLPEEDS